MKSDSSLMTEIGQTSGLLRVITPEESEKLKRLLLEMLKDLYRVCKKKDLHLILVGGSALGAVRHKGFIPWDDDLDVGLIRKEYDKLLESLEAGELGDKYEFTYPKKEKDSKNLFLKIYRKDTLYTEISDINSPFPNGVFIDVFPIDNTSSNRWLRQIKGFCSDLLSFISVSVLYAEYPSESMERFMSENKIAYKRYKLRLIIGKLGKLLGCHSRWAYAFDKFVQKKKDTGLLTIPTGRKHYSGEVLNSDVFFPPSQGEFEGIEVLLPHQSNLYLSNLYGNYMWIPPEDKREKHYIVDFKI